MSDPFYQGMSQRLNEDLDRIEQKLAQYRIDMSRYRDALKTTVVRRLCAGILLTVACYAFMFDHVNTGLVWWLMILAISAHAALTAAASVMFLTRYSFLIALLVGFLTGDAVGYMFADEHYLLPALLPMMLAMTVLPLIFRRPKPPEDVDTLVNHL